MKKVIYVDFDGTLASGSLDKVFRDLCKEAGFENVIDWYNECEVDDLELNMDLINELIELKDKGYKLVLWKNRGISNKGMTRRNLGKYWDLFDDYEFHSGKKGKCKLSGIVYDNEEKYLECGVEGRLFNYCA